MLALSFDKAPVPEIKPVKLMALLESSDKFDKLAMLPPIEHSLSDAGSGGYSGGVQAHGVFSGTPCDGPARGGDAGGKGSGFGEFVKLGSRFRGNDI